MHGTIVVISDRETVMKDEEYCPYADYEMMDWIPGCDWVLADTESEFQESIAFFNKAYGLDVQTATLDIDGGARMEVGILDRGCLQSLMEALQKQKEERLEKVRKELEKPDPSMWQIADNAYLDSSVYFVMVLGGGASMSFDNEMDFYKSIEIEDAPLYVVETYRFHV